MIRIEKPLFPSNTNRFSLNIHKKKICYFLFCKKQANRYEKKRTFSPLDKRVNKTYSLAKLLEKTKRNQQSLKIDSPHLSKRTFEQHSIREATNN